jgi:streptomycin 6-kinase
VPIYNGDLHHENILLDARHGRWLAIDPKGLAGEPAYETGALLRNQLPDPWDSARARRMLARRVDQLAEQLGLERVRLRGWGLAQAVLSAWWRIEDEGYGWEPTIACTEALASLPG